MRRTQRLCQVEYYGGSMLRSLLLSVFVNGLEEVTEGTFSDSADDTKLGGTANRPAGTAAIRKDLEMLKEGTRGKRMKFSKDNRQVLALGRTLWCRDAGWSLPLAGSFSAGRDLGLCPGGRDGQRHPGLPTQGGSQEAEGKDYSPPCLAG